MKRLFSIGSILLLSCGAAPIANDDLAKVFENLGKLHDIATVVETYALEIDPENLPAVGYLILAYRQAAAVETDAVKQAALTAKSDALRARAMQMVEAKKNANKAPQQ